MKTRKLTSNTKAKYQRVVDEWFVNKFNGAAAYREFYPNVKKDTTATVNFSKIQALPEIRAYIKLKHEEAAKVIQSTHEGILRELLNWMQADITETIGLSPQEVKELPIEVKRLITKYKHKKKHHYNDEGHKTSTEEIIEFHFVSKERAADMINKHLGFYEADNQQKATEINISTTNEKHMLLVENIINGIT